MPIAPIILNDDPLVIPVPLSDPYYSYYTIGTNMGTFQHDDVFIFKFIGYNPNATLDQDPYSYDLLYTIDSITQITPTPVFNPFSTLVMPDPLDSSNTSIDGWVNGTLNNIGSNIIEYQIQVTLSLASDTSLSATKTFQFILNGGIDTTVEWDTDSNLGTIVNGAISNLSVSAKFGQGMTVKYSLLSGELPPGLELLEDGNISGRAEFQLDPAIVEYNFTIEAYSDTYSALVNSVREFRLAVDIKYGIDADTPPYDTIYIKGLISTADREIIDGLLTTIKTEQANNIYRIDDRYFGVSSELKYEHQYGVYSVSAVSPLNDNYFYDDYYEALQRNFYWKYLTLGPIKTAQARDASGAVIYEVIYSEIIDDLVNTKGQSISKQVAFSNEITTYSGPYWTSWETIFTSNTYYDLLPVPKAITRNITGSMTIPVNSIDNLFIGMQLAGFPGVTVTNDINGFPPEITSIDATNNEVTVSVAQNIDFKQQILFYIPITTANTDVRISPLLYPNSLWNMREQVASQLRQYTDSSLLPLWMTSQQSDGSTLGLTSAWVMCYTKPGKSAEVLGQLNSSTDTYPAGTINRYLSDIDIVLNQICFEIDRIEVDRSLTYTWGQNSFNTWPTTPPSVSVSDNSEDAFINFPKKTILR